VKKRVSVGQDFEIRLAILELTGSTWHEATKSWIVKAVFCGSAVALAVSAGIGGVDGTFNELQAVWNVGGGILGAIRGHYFGSRIDAHGAGPPA
jgi:putative effector of murein hydrolase